MTARRDVLKSLALAGILPSAFESSLEAFTGEQSRSSIGAQGDAQAREFWETFLQRQGVPASSVSELGTTTRQNDAGREPFFFYYDKDGCRPAVKITPDQLVANGDLQITMNVQGFKPSREDQATFERLLNAQFRLDVIQSHPILNFIDPMAWTSAAALHPTRAGKLPPLQNLNFDPASSAKSQDFLLPGGEGRWAINVTAQRKDSFFSQILRRVVPELGKFGPFLALPAISVVALNSFNAFYGALHDMPMSLFKGAPVPIYGTSVALESSGSTKGIPIRTGTYVLVPNADAEKLPDDRLQTLELQDGYLVPKHTAPTLVYKEAPNAVPDVTYMTLSVSVKPSNATADIKGKGAA